MGIDPIPVALPMIKACSIIPRDYICLRGIFPYIAGKLTSSALSASRGTVSTALP